MTPGSKYHNTPVTLDGIKFASQAESRRYSELLLREIAGEIHNLRVHPSYLLQTGFKRDGKTYQPITFVADFEYVEEGKVIVEDVKGVVTPTFRIKEKLFVRRFPEKVFRIIWV